MADDVKLYGVSYGNGNDGISHMYPDFYVWTNDPYRLAKLAMVSQFKDDWQEMAITECLIDDMGEDCVQACIFNPLNETNEEGEMSYCDVNGAAYLVDVFAIIPADEKVRAEKSGKCYDGLTDCFGTLIEKVGAE